MCHRSVVAFFRDEMTTVEIEGRRVLEVGSRNVNGTVRPFLTALGARDYLGVDMVPGPGVDRLCDVADLASEFASDSFEVVVTTEMLEHVKDWRTAISNLKRVVAPDGLLVVTTRSFGFPYHDYPGDYWRYEIDDMRQLFRDFRILTLLPDPEYPGVFLKCRKPAAFREADVSAHRLFSVVKGERCEPDRVGEQEILAYQERMAQLVEIGADVARALQSVDLADAGQRDFRRVWQAVERLADLIEGVTPASGSAAPAPRWARGARRIRRRVLEGLTAARLVRGLSFGRARRALLESASGASRTNVQRVPWATVEDERFREILGVARSLREACEKVRSYARPAAGG